MNSKKQTDTHQKPQKAAKLQKAPEPQKVPQPQKAPKLTVKENPKATILKKAPEKALALAIREMMRK